MTKAQEHNAAGEVYSARAGWSSRPVGPDLSGAGAEPEGAKGEHQDNPRFSGDVGPRDTQGGLSGAKELITAHLGTAVLSTSSKSALRLK
jgi:hypothetical protein